MLLVATLLSASASAHQMQIEKKRTQIVDVCEAVLNMDLITGSLVTINDFEQPKENTCARINYSAEKGQPRVSVMASATGNMEGEWKTIMIAMNTGSENIEGSPFSYFREAIYRVLAGQNNAHHEQVALYDGIWNPDFEQQVITNQFTDEMPFYRKYGAHITKVNNDMGGYVLTLNLLRDPLTSP